MLDLFISSSSLGISFISTSSFIDRVPGKKCLSLSMSLKLWKMWSLDYVCIIFSKYQVYARTRMPYNFCFIILKWKIEVGYDKNWCWILFSCHKRNDIDRYICRKRPQLFYFMTRNSLCSFSAFNCLQSI